MRTTTSLLALCACAGPTGYARRVAPSADRSYGEHTTTNKVSDIAKIEFASGEHRNWNTQFADEVDAPKSLSQVEQVTMSPANALSTLLSRLKLPAAAVRNAFSGLVVRSRLPGMLTAERPRIPWIDNDSGQENYLHPAAPEQSHDPNMFTGKPAVDRILNMSLAALRRHTHLASGPIPVDPHLSKALLDNMGVGGCPSLLEVLPRNFIVGANGAPAPSADLCTFVSALAGVVASNPHLLSVLEASSAGEMSETSCSDEELYRIVHHHIVLELVTNACACDPQLAKVIFACARQALYEKERPLTAWENIKTRLIEMSLELFDKYRIENPIYEQFGSIGVPVNILHGGLKDLSGGHFHNAWASIPLALARPGHACASVSNDTRRVVLMHTPLPKEWKDLYISLNLALVGSFWADVPYFAAALLVPCIHEAPDEEFLFYRAYALYLQIVAHARARGANSRGSTPAQGSHDWRNKQILELWGRTNARAAISFCSNLLEELLQKKEPLEATDKLVEEHIPPKGNPEKGIAKQFVAEVFSRSTIRPPKL
jgi:hypothetical protein